MPISSLAGLPVSGWLVSRFDSRLPLTIGFITTCVALTLIGFAPTKTLLIVSICLFSFSLRIFNIAANTQALSVQKLFEKKINGSFHGLWSTGGIVGVGFCTLLIALKVPMWIHMLIIAFLAVIVTVVSYKHLLRNDRTPSQSKPSLRNPDPYIMYLGFLVFLAAICEGGMFDWSGIYFKEVVKVELFTLGYLAFMICMAVSRFASDWVMERFGMPKTYIISGSLISFGILLAVLFPSFWPSLIGFCLVGFGTAAVIPMTYLLAGRSIKYSPGMAISIIATYGTIGMLIGPPMIGYLAHAFNLKNAFISFALGGLLIFPLSQSFFKYRQRKAI